MKFTDKRIEEVSDERKFGDGIWLYLIKGWCRDDGAHCVHEDTVKECKEELKYIQVCTCERCTKID